MNYFSAYTVSTSATITAFTEVREFAGRYLQRTNGGPWLCAASGETDLWDMWRMPCK